MKNAGTVLLFLSLSAWGQSDAIKLTRESQINKNNESTKNIVRETCNLISHELTQNSCIKSGNEFLEKHPGIPCRQKAFRLYKFNLISHLCSSLTDTKLRANCYFDAYAEAFPVSEKQIERNKCLADRKLRRMSPDCWTSYKLAVQDPCQTINAGTPKYASCFEKYIAEQVESSYDVVIALHSEITENKKINKSDPDQVCGAQDQDITLDIMAAAASNTVKEVIVDHTIPTPQNIKITNSAGN